MGIDLFVSPDTVSGGGPPTGAAGGHLGGSYPSPTVQILASNASINCAGAANITLTAGQYNNVTLDFTGLLTGNISVILPLNAHQQWEAFNNTTGAFTITVIGATGAGVVMPQAQRALVTTDGTNFVFATPPVTAAGAVASASYTAPTGSGVPHIIGGSQQAASFVGLAYQSLQTNAGGTDVVFGAVRLDQAAAISGVLPVASIAAGAAGTVLAGPGPAYTGSPAISGAVTVGSLGGYAAQAFGWAAASVSVAGGVSVTLTTAQAQNRNLTFTGAISADIAAAIPVGTALVVGSEYTLTNATTSTTPTTAAWILTFKAATSGTGIWLPPNIPIKAIWTGTDFIYGDGSFGGGDITIVLPMANPIGTYPVAVAKVPQGFQLTQATARPAATVTVSAGGVVNIEAGTAAAGSAGEASILLATAGGIQGAAPWSSQPYGTTGATDLGTDMASAQGYAHTYLVATTLFFSSKITVAACTGGSVSVTFRGALVP